MTRSPAPRPSATGRIPAAAGAALLALTLLGSGFGTAARSGAARHDADPADWWGSELQHVALDLGTPTVTLAQN